MTTLLTTCTVLALAGACATDDVADDLGEDTADTSVDDSEYPPNGAEATDHGDLDDVQPSAAADDDALDAIAAVTPRIKVRAIKRSDLASKPAPVRAAVGALFESRTGDFDADGMLDTLGFKAKEVTIKLGNGKVFRFAVPKDNQFFSAIEPIGLGAKNRTSFMLSVYSYDSWYNRAPQVLLYNDAGVYKMRVLTNVNSIGRDVTCTKLSINWNRGLCMVASYARDKRAYSALVEIAADGTATAVTQSKGLPWSASGTSVPSGQYHNGKYMMGFAFVDVNRDGLPDLVGAGQHSAIGYALMQKDGTSYRFSPVTWFDNQDEYMDVSALNKQHTAFPCVYAHIESPEASRSPRGDFLTCFDRGSSTWTPQPMPAKTSDGATIKQFVMDARDARMVDVGGAVYIVSKAKLGNDSVEDIFLEVVPNDGTPAIVDTLLRSEVFDPLYYLELHGDLEQSFGGTLHVERAAAHWMSRGAEGGRRGSERFWSKTYLSRYADLRQAFGDDYVAAIRHYINHGIREGRDGN